MGKDILGKLGRWERGFIRKMLKLKWKGEGEGKFRYNIRTSGLIKKWQEAFNLQPIYIRILHAVHREAWHERAGRTDSHLSIVETLRTMRSRDRFDNVKNVPFSQRKEEGWTHGTRGNILLWDDVLVDFYGPDWRLTRDQGTYRSWEAGASKFVRHVCQKWDLLYFDGSKPATHHTPVTEAEAAKRAKSTPYLLPTMIWCNPGRCFQLYTDSQIIQRIICGHSKLTSAYFVPAFTRCTNNLVSILDLGWKTAQSYTDPIVWVSRNFNSVADRFATNTMRKGTSWNRIWRENFHGTRGNNLTGFSDGGSRDDWGVSASAWVIGTNTGEGDGQHWKPLVAGGVFFNKTNSSFMVETVAADNMIADLHKLVHGTLCPDIQPL